MHLDSGRDIGVDLELGRIELDQAARASSFSEEGKFSKEGLTFDDVLLIPAASHVLPKDG